MREALALLIPACAIGLFLFPVLPALATTVSTRTVAAGLRPAVLAGAPSFHAVCIALALCLGIGFSSLTPSLSSSSASRPRRRRFVLTDVAIWTSVGALGWWTRHAEAPSDPGAETRSQRREPDAESREHPSRACSTGSCAPHLAVTAARRARGSDVVLSLASPHGDWDAWAIWNQHARFLFRGGGSDAWRGFFAITWSQPDYPLLLPASVARVWAYAGHESTLGPALIAMVFGIASVALVVTTLDWPPCMDRRCADPRRPTFLSQVSSQCADVPLACFIVVTLAVACGDVLRSLGFRIPDAGLRCRRHERHGGMDEERRARLCAADAAGRGAAAIEGSLEPYGAAARDGNCCGGSLGGAPS